MTELLYRSDAYARACEATVLAVTDRGGIVLDRTVFYATAGGQPGDRGEIALPGGQRIAIATAVYGEPDTDIVHVPASPDLLLEPGSAVEAAIDWGIRHRHMRVHSALHLLCALVPFPVTGGGIAPDGGRLDFDIHDPSAVDKDRLTAELNRLIEEDHPVSERWIAAADLDDQLVRTMSVKPPMASGRIRLVAIGENGTVDLQACGGTHVRSTGEIGPVRVEKIENKGKQNRRIRMALL
ncbi:MAG TPA: alanyl-tRNA editing protein [Aestuariivirgaceae bacterium]|nr:alanyl-tRNA editing protein [Aestuariivirgaceae bacterium]